MYPRCVTVYPGTQERAFSRAQFSSVAQLLDGEGRSSIPGDLQTPSERPQNQIIFIIILRYYLHFSLLEKQWKALMDSGGHEQTQ